MDNTSSKFHRIIKLRQDTPMWHFQSEQNGCCLRASEVKPKLDRFLAEKENKEYTSLEYKMYFIVKGKQSDIKDTYKGPKGRERDRFPLFFGNMKNPDQKHLVYYNNQCSIEMHLISFHADLLEKIEASLPEFFAYHSFGTRQDKGFGFFYPTEKNFKATGASYCFKTTPSKNNDITERFEHLFKFIEMFHKMIRSGVNLPYVYCKSFMYHYAKSLKNNENEAVNWDKPIIRHHFCLKHPTYLQKCGVKEGKFTVQDEMKVLYQDLKKTKDEQYKGVLFMFRDALGLSGIQEWKAYNKTLAIEGQGVLNKQPISIKRFKSPIIYRPVRQKDGCYIVYIYLNPIPETYRNAKFTITDKPRKNNPYPTSKPLGDMKIYDHFDLEEYFDFIIDFCNKKEVTMKGKNIYIQKLFIDNREDKKLNFRKISHKEQESWEQENSI